MSDPTKSGKDGTGGTRQAAQELRSMARWKKVMLALSLAFVAVGLVLAFVEPTGAGPSDASSPGGGGALPGGARGRARRAVCSS